jgi:biopolymer transport protein ExbB/TolQ
MSALAQLAAVNDVERLLFDVAEALRIPVLILALASIAFVLVEAGALVAELVRRRGRGVLRLEEGVESIRAALAAGDKAAAAETARALGYNGRMSDALGAIVEQRDADRAADRIAKRMAEYDYWSLKRLERTRILVRTGPAVGLMGTLIPLSPALEGLAQGNVEQLSTDLRVAFSVTVAGLIVGVIAFGISLIRDRLYAQDFSDVEYVQASLEPAPEAAPAPVAA